MIRNGEVIDAKSLPCGYRVYSRAKKEMVWTKPSVDCGGEFCVRCQVQDCGNCTHNDCDSCGWNVNEAMRRAACGRFEPRQRIFGDEVFELRSLHFEGLPRRTGGEAANGDPSEGPA